MANQNYADFIPSGANTLSILSDDETISTASQTDSSESLRDIASQSDSLSDEPYHELFQLMQRGAPPQVHWTCVRCEAQFPSSGGLLDHHVTSCVHRNISPTAVFSTNTMVTLLKQVDPEHPVDGQQVWWVDTGKDAGESEEVPSEGKEPEEYQEEVEGEKVNKIFVWDAPAWLTAEQKKEWEKRKDRELLKLLPHYIADKLIRIDQDSKPDANSQASKWKIRHRRCNGRVEPDFWSSCWIP